jgi:hypothetical protein
LIGLLAIFVVAATAILALNRLIGGDAEGGTVKGPAGSPFTIERPSGWTALSSAQLEALPGSVSVALRREDGRGLVIVNEQARGSHDFARISSDLDSALRKDVPDFKKLSSHTVGVKAGAAFVYSYVRTRERTANSVVVVPAGRRTYTISAVVTGGAENVAHQVGAMIRSFDA